VSVEVVYETHSVSVDNERGFATGWLDGRLSEQGKQLAKKLGDRRRHDDISTPGRPELFSDEPLRPRARLMVSPDDFPFRDCVLSHRPGTHRCRSSSGTPSGGLHLVHEGVPLVRELRDPDDVVALLAAAELEGGRLANGARGGHGAQMG